MQPSTAEERRTENQQPQKARNPLKFNALRGYVQRFEQWTLEWVDWSDPDEWRKRLANTTKISPADENTPFLEAMRENDVELEDDIACFIQPSISSARWERRVLHIAGFCVGAEFTLHNTIPVDPAVSQLIGAQEPEAWVSDRNWVDETLVGPRPNYPPILNNRQLYLVLQKKRFPEGSQGDVAGPPRRIYIKNPNGASVAAIIKTTPASQVEGFRDLFAGYITPTPEPNFILRESEWWGGCLVISFDIPYYGISSRKRQDCRTIFNSRKRLRKQLDLDFLHMKGHGLSADESASFHDDPILHEAVFSFTVTVIKEHYWTVGCFDDDFFEEEPRLPSEDETLVLDGDTDPILLKADGNLTKSSRSYALAALAIALYKTVEHHGNIQDWFKNSLSLHTSDAEDGSLEKISAKELQNWIEKFPEALNHVIHSTSNLVRKLDHFLEEDVIFGPDAQPRGVLWQSLQNDAAASRSLLRIKQHRNKLRDIDTELRQLAIACKEVRRKRQTDHEGEQQVITKQLCKIAIAAFVSMIPGTVAQLYSGKPSKDDSEDWPWYWAMVVFCVLMGIAIAVYLCWQQVRRWFARVVAFLSETFRAVRGRA
ncbi:hypothetical protein NCS57_00151500 [Fusarium keratoplasticum]|uniref:Uncharacterized protein n=1 Tax=Fusarium keratoplasticum TaxID=1328300 RepID=A0ACC0RI06_9HYPO|nr:hypothetical protein NCS57_00151500 [Fusarium keratoplasticum]KAI8684844.1 hypothetical protein NCS57_00151500 [Fusarium keratoplasticum]